MNKTAPVFLLGLLLTALATQTSAQDLMDLLAEEEETQPMYVTNTFFTTRVINGQSVENPYPGDLIFIVSHHFGRLNQGAYDLWGLDQATIRLGLEYGLGERLALSVGRSSYEKTFDAFFKYKLLRQQTDSQQMPLTASWFSGVYIKTLRWLPTEQNRGFTDRLAYVNQLLIARRFSRTFSAQLSPAWVHINQTGHASDPNDYFVLGLSGRTRISDWFALNVEYFYRFMEPVSYESNNSFSVGFDLDTGGHVFQLHFTNSQPMFEKGFQTDTRGSWFNGDIYFGFHISRVFTLR